MNNAGDAGIALVNADARRRGRKAARDDAAAGALPRSGPGGRCAGSITYDGGFASFDIYAFGTLLCRASLSVIGSFRVSNALAAAASAPVGRQREGNRARTVGIPRGRAAV